MQILVNMLRGTVHQQQRAAAYAVTISNGHSGAASAATFLVGVAAARVELGAGAESDFAFFSRSRVPI